MYYIYQDICMQFMYTYLLHALSVSRMLSMDGLCFVLMKNFVDFTISPLSMQSMDGEILKSKVYMRVCVCK